jgi:indole-3-glycerol phosphate synthase
MKTILDQIIVTKQKEVDYLKSKFSYSDFEKATFFSTPSRSIVKHLEESQFGIIAEIKRKSPSAGMINAQLNIEHQGKLYESSGAIAISCLTDHFYFGGSNEDLKLLKEITSIPVLRKEFIIDEIQVFESKAIGADAILLIAEVLTAEQALHLTIIAQSLGMEVIMECHSFNELKKVNNLVDIIGVNNRNLHDNQTNLQTSFDLYPFISEGKLCISESGIQTKQDIQRLCEKGYHGALIGESILRERNPQEFIESIHIESKQSC